LEAADLQLTAHPQGTLLAVRARAGGRVNGVVGVRQGALMVSVTQAPEKGKANQAIANVLAEVFRCGKMQIELVRGQTSPDKQFLLVGMDHKHVIERIKTVLGA
jgi:uncharacterized protein (TIGR00251 family)